MSLKNLFHKEAREKEAAAACGTACGAGDKQPLGTARRLRHSLWRWG